ncbi:MAG: hypothetical protein ACLR4Z_07755 [Butyricicoccaceae bacterium]
MPSGTGLTCFCAMNSGTLLRCRHRGGACQSAMAAGMAAQGLRAGRLRIYSTFLQRAYDQIVHDVAIEGLHVVFCRGPRGHCRRGRRNPQRRARCRVSCALSRA